MLRPRPHLTNLSHPLEYLWLFLLFKSPKNLDQVDSSNEFNLVVLEVYMLEKIVVFF
jgi:hypothetical protein